MSEIVNMTVQLVVFSALWRIRECATESLKFEGYTYKQDISLPPADFYDVVTATREHMSDLAPHMVTRIIAYGHLGDGNIHLNLTSRVFEQQVYDRLYPWLYEWIHDHGGSISAEHGIGTAKRDYLTLVKSPEVLSVMRNLKHILDPNWILNPSKILQLPQSS